jgi:hypothetical protein
MGLGSSVPMRAATVTASSPGNARVPEMASYRVAARENWSLAGLKLLPLIVSGAL